MALSPGSKFSYGDLAALTGPANALAARNFDTSAYFDVSPMYYDPNNQKYGYRLCGAFALQNQGLGYTVGDLLTAPNCSFEVAKTDSTGRIVGLVIINNAGFSPGNAGANWETANDPASPQNLAGGTGNGASIAFVVSRVGPSQNYSMPDYPTTFAAGYFTKLVLNNPGINYAAGDTFVVTELNFPALQATVTVNAVDPAGRITNYTVAPAFLSPNNKVPIPVDVLSMGVTGGTGTGATFTGWFVIPQKQQWLTELQRMRNNIWAIPDFIHGDDPRQCVSGPWPVGSPTANFKDTWFWFAGNNAEVDLVSQFQPCTPKFTLIPRSFYYSDIPDGLGPATFSNGLIANTLTVSFILGGNQNMAAAGYVFLMLPAVIGAVKVNPPGGAPPVITPDATDPASLVSVAATNFPGPITFATVTTKAGGQPLPQPLVIVSCKLPASLAPGRYDLTLNIADGGQDSDIIDNSFNRTQTQHTFIDVLNSYLNGGLPPDSWILNPSTTLAGAGFLSTAGGDLQVSGNATATIAFKNAVPAPGIHNSLPVKRIQLPGDALGNAPGFSAVDQVQVVSTRTNYNAGGFYNVGDTFIDPNGNTQTCIVAGGTQLIGLYGSWWIDEGNANLYDMSNSGLQLPPNGWATNLGGQTIASVDVTAPGAAVFELTAININAPDWTLYPYTNPNFRERIIYGGIQITTSVPGLWTAYCPPVSSLNIVPASAMPWNLTRTKYSRPPGGQVNSIQVNPMLYGDLAVTQTTGPNAYKPQVSNSYDQTLTCEEQQEPPPWIAQRVFTPDFTIMDPNGNTQKCGQYGMSGLNAPGFSSGKGGKTYDGGAPGPGTLVWNCIKVFKPATNWKSNNNYAAGATVTDANGNLQTAATAGRSGAATPNWSKLFNGLTYDGTVVWTLSGPAKPVKPTQHRFPDLPRYPHYWSAETIARLKPPVAGTALTVWGNYTQWKSVNATGTGGNDPGWNDVAVPENPNGRGMAYGWWIYQIALNRLTVNAPAIPVTIGCIRNGAFVSFGVYNTGGIYHVLWPVFTSDALVYQCSERIDLQPLAIAQTSAVSNGQDITKPFCSAFVTDTIALLGLIT